jgi:hypothetical protein
MEGPIGKRLRKRDIHTVEVTPLPLKPRMSVAYLSPSKKHFAPESLGTLQYTANFPQNELEERLKHYHDALRKGKPQATEFFRHGSRTS